VSSTGIAAPPASHHPQVSAKRLARSSSTIPTAAAEALDRDQLLDRLQHLRTILPVFAQELATARRHTAQLRKDNRRLLEEIHRLQREHGQRNTTQRRATAVQTPTARASTRLP
jgi:hypothetical protein